MIRTDTYEYWPRRIDEIIYALKRFVTVPPSAQWVGPWRDGHSYRLGRELYRLAVKLGWPVSENP
jgi:hypothetical protein